MPVSATVTFGKTLTNVSVKDLVTREFCVGDDGKIISDINVSANSTKSFSCEQDENDQYAGKVAISGIEKDKSGQETTHQNFYRLEDIDNKLTFPK